MVQAPLAVGLALLFHQAWGFLLHTGWLKDHIFVPLTPHMEKFVRPDDAIDGPPILLAGIVFVSAQFILWSKMTRLSAIESVALGAVYGVAAILNMEILLKGVIKEWYDWPFFLVEGGLWAAPCGAVAGYLFAPFTGNGEEGKRKPA